MNAELTGALAATNLDDGQTHVWLDALTEAYQSQDGWDGFTLRLKTLADGELADATESFLRYADAHGRLDLVRDLVTTRPSPAEDHSTATDGTAQDAPWTRVVEQFGPGWAEWDGSETGWTQYRDWLYTAANEQDPDMYAAAYHQLDPLNHAPLDERAARLRELGFTITAAATEEAGPAIPEEVLEQYPVEIQTMLTSEQGRSAIEEKQSHAAALLDENPKFAEIDPQRRQELIMQVVAEQLAG